MYFKIRKIMNYIYTLSFLLGYLISILYRKRSITHGPNSNDIKKTIYFDENKNYYRFIPYPVICPI